MGIQGGEGTIEIDGATIAAIREWTLDADVADVGGFGKHWDTEMVKTFGAVWGGGTLGPDLLTPEQAELMRTLRTVGTRFWLEDVECEVTAVDEDETVHFAQVADGRT